MRDLLWKLLKWIVNIVTAVNLLFLIIKIPTYQSQMKRFDDMQNSCRNVDWKVAKQMACVATVTDESSKYVDGVRANAVWGIYLPVIFYGGLFLYRDLLLKSKE